MKRIIYLLLAIFCFQTVAAQDSLKTLSINELFAIIKTNHPIVLQSQININKAKAELIVAKGGFDPILKTEAAQKTFDGNTYYDYNNPELKIPTWYGIEVFTGIENVAGSRTDPTETLGKTSYFGISVPLARNLVFDKRRAALQQAKIMQNLSVADQQSIINNLLQDASIAYWNWVLNYELLTIITNITNTGQRRLGLIKNAVINGDRPAMDSTEAVAQLQLFEYLKTDVWLAFTNAGIELSAYTWQNNNPINLPDYVKPNINEQIDKTEKLFNQPLENLLLAALANHPDLKVYNFKLQTLEVNKKLKFQEMLPNLNFKYQNLGKGYNVLKTATAPLFNNNYNYGLSFSMPLRLSQGRGEYKIAKLKIEETLLDINLKKQSIENKIKYYYNQQQTYFNQIKLMEKNYTLYQQLLRGEEARFFNGESSLFMINSREAKVLETAQKLIEVKIKYFKAGYLLQGVAGSLGF